MDHLPIFGKFHNLANSQSRNTRKNLFDDKVLLKIVKIEWIFLNDIDGVEVDL